MRDDVWTAGRPCEVEDLLLGVGKPRGKERRGKSKEVAKHTTVRSLP